MIQHVTLELRHADAPAEARFWELLGFAPIEPPASLRGREAIRDRAAEVMAAFSDFRLERLVLLIDGDTNADRWRASGTHSGAPFLGIEPSGRSFDVEGASFSWFDADGLVVRDIHHWDVPSLLTQLGVL